MHPTTLISNAITGHPDLPDMPCTPEPGVCAVTGRSGFTVPRKKLFGASFMDGDCLAIPDSDRVSIEAYRSLKFKWERMGSWICDGETFTRLDRVGVRDAVFGDLPSRPWAGYATTSYKKHGALRAPVNHGKRRVWLFETRLVDCTDNVRVTEIWDRLNVEIRRGFGRTILESVQCPSHVIRKMGMREWISFKLWARPVSNSALYAFMCYLLPSQKELRDEQDQRSIDDVHNSCDVEAVSSEGGQASLFSGLC